MIIVAPFPRPPVLVAHALRDLRIVRSGDTDAIAELGDPDYLPRPWLPASCSDQLRHHVWLWCEDVATWINESYIWRSTQMIPDCWPQHPHIANELPALACQRVQAEDSAGYDLIEEWHRQTLVLYLDRIVARLGDACRGGKHADWPAAARFDASQSKPVIAGRQDRFYLDTHPPRQLLPTQDGTG